jgi:hypothetical protein
MIHFFLTKLIEWGENEKKRGFERKKEGKKEREREREREREKERKRIKSKLFAHH